MKYRGDSAYQALIQAVTRYHEALGPFVSEADIFTRSLLNHAEDPSRWSWGSEPEDNVFDLVRSLQEESDWWQARLDKRRELVGDWRHAEERATSAEGFMIVGEGLVPEMSSVYKSHRSAVIHYNRAVRMGGMDARERRIAPAREAWAAGAAKRLQGLMVLARAEAMFRAVVLPMAAERFGLEAFGRDTGGNLGRLETWLPRELLRDIPEWTAYAVQRQIEGAA